MSSLKDRLTPEVVAEAARRAQEAQAGQSQPDEGAAVPTGEATQTAESGAGEAGQQAPWEKRGEPYDADKAATLIRNLRAERSDLQDELRRAKSEVETLLRQSSAGPRDAQRLAALEAEVSELQEQNAKYRRANALARAGISEEFTDLLTGRTDEEISGQVQRLVALASSLAPGGFQEPAQHATGDTTGGDTNALWKRGLGF